MKISSKILLLNFRYGGNRTKLTKFVLKIIGAVIKICKWNWQFKIAIGKFNQGKDCFLGKSKGIGNLLKHRRLRELRRKM